jgi:CRAL/TRIO domain
MHTIQEQRIDLVRACFLGDDIVEFDNDEDRAKVLELRRLIEADLAKQHAYCRGHDKDGLAIMIQRSRTAGTNNSSKGGPEDAEDGFVATVLYTMERAIAVTESHSLGALEKIMVVLDFKTFKSSLAPSWNAIKRVATILQNRYPERLKKLVVIDPPFWMRTMYSLLSPFLDPETKAKFVVVSGDAKKQSIISEFIDVDNAMPFLLPKGKLVDPVDLDCYLKQVPFCQTYAKM